MIFKSYWTQFKYMLNIFIFLKTAFCQKLIKNDAAEAQEPFRKMRLEKIFWNQGLTSPVDEF